MRARRRSFLFGCALGSVALAALHASPANAQAINATPSTTGGNVTYSRFTAPTPNSETITVETDQAIINWTPVLPPSGPWIFLPNGNIVTFQNGVNVSNFAVLNRILPTAGAARFDGRVISQLRDASGNVLGRGGTVVFSSPAGIIVGPTGAFDVGSLVLTTLAVADDGAGNFLSPNGGFQYELSGDSSSGSIITEADSEINALAEGSYVALVAPQVTHGGAIRVNGSAAFIGAEQVSFSVNEGLFDIQVTTGSGNATPIVHTGSTGGPASTGGTDNHGIYMVAVPKNQAITMLLEGSVGFDAATDVTVENGVIVLSAGYDVPNGVISRRPDSTFAADIEINGGTFTSDVLAQASGDATATAAAGDPLTFTGDLTMQAPGTVALIADAGSLARVDGDLELIGVDPDTRAPGEARLEARTGSTMTLGGNVTLSADHFPGIGLTDSIPVTGQSTQGGTATVFAQGGTITIAGDLGVSASAAAGFGSSLGGNATGGTAVVEANGGSIAVTGDVTVLAIALGGASNQTGGNAQGGTARVSSLGGSIGIDGLLFVSSSAVGGSGVRSPALQAGTGFGGTSIVEAIADEGIGGALSADAGVVVFADGGSILLPAGVFGSPDPLFIGPTGAGEGGRVDVIVRGGSLTSQNLLVSARGLGGDAVAATSGDGPTGYAGQGGDVTIEFSDTTSSVGLLAVTVLGQGGRGGDGAPALSVPGGAGGAGGAGSGGTVDLLVQGGTTTAGVTTINARGEGGTGGAGGDQSLLPGGAGGLGTGGGIVVTAGAGGVLETSILIADASGAGGVGGAGSFGFDVGGTGGIGGEGQGGSARIATTGGDIDIAGADPLLAILASGFGGTGGTGGATTGDIGPGGDGGAGGTATGGTAEIDIAGGSITTPLTSVDSSGSGGAGGSAGANPFFSGTAGADGNGAGGLSRIAIADGNAVPGGASLGVTFMSSSGFSGSGFSTLADTAGRLVFADSASGEVLLDELEAFAEGQASTTSPAFLFTSSNGPVEVDGDVTVQVSGDVSIAATGNGGLQAGGAVDIVAGGAMLFDHQARPSDSFTLAGGSVDLLAQNNITGNAESLIAGRSGDVNISAAAVALGRITATRDLVIDADSISFAFGTAGRDLDLDAIGDIAVGFAQAGDDFTASTDGAFTGGTVIATGLGADSEVDSSSGLAGSNILVFAFGEVRLDNGDAFDDLSLTSVESNVLSDGLLDSGADLELRAGTDTLDEVDIRINDASAGGVMNLEATGALVADVLTAGGDITANLGTDAIVNSIVTGGSLLLFADRVVDLGTVVAADDVIIDPTSIDIDSVEAGGDITLEADGDIRVGFAQAGDDFTATAGGTFTGGTVIATGLGPDSDDAFPGSNIIVDSNGDLRLDNGTAPDTIDLASATGSVLSAGTLTADQLLVSAAVNIDLNDVDVVDSLVLSTSNGFIDGNSFSTDGTLSLNASGRITVNSADSGGSLFVTAGDVADLGTLVSDISISIAAPTILLDSATAFIDIDLRSPGDINVGFAQAGDDFTASAGGIFTGGTVIATGLGPDSEQGSGALGFSNIVVDAAGNLTLTNGDAANDIRLTSTDASVFSTGLLDAGRDIDIAAIDVVDLATLVAGRNVVVDPVTILIDSITAGGDIILDASADITVGFAQAGDDFTANAGTTFTGTTVIATGLGVDSEQGVGPLAGSGNILVNAGGDLRLDNGDAALDIRLTSRGGSILSSTLLTAGRDVDADAAQDIDLNEVDAGGFIFLLARAGFVDAQSLLAGSTIVSQSAGETRIDFADAADFISVTAGGAALLGTLSAGEDISVDALRITLASGTAGSDVSLLADQDIAVTSAQVGDDFVANAGTTFTGTTIVATGGPDDDLIEGPFPGSNIIVDAVGDLRLDTGTAPDLIDLASTNGSIFSSGTLTADTLLAVAAFDLLLNDVFVVSDLNLTTSNGDIAGNSFNSDGDISLDSAGDVTLAAADSGGTILVDANGTATLGTFNAAGNITVNAATLSFSTAIAGGDIGLVASGDIGVGFAQAGDDFVANAGGIFAATTVIATGSGTDSESGTGALAGGNIVIDSNGDLRLDNGNGADTIDLASATGSIFSNGTLSADLLLAEAALDLALNNVFVVEDLELSTPNGSISGNRFNSDGDIDLDASGEIDLAAANSGGTITLLGGGDVRLDNGAAAGSIVLTSSAGSVFSDPVGGGGGSDSIGPLNGLLTAGDDILITAAIDILIDDAQAGDTIQLDAGRDVRVRNLTAGQSVDIEALGSAGFDGQVSAPSIAVTSSDIDIGASGALGNSSTQLVSLTALATGQPVVLGGSTEGPGYTLTDAEADRIAAATLRVQAPQNGSGANRPADVQIRDLSLSGQRIGTFALVTSGIAEVNGALILSGVQPTGGIDITATERLQVVTPTGSIRVRDSSGLTAGSLTIASNNIWSASQTLLDQLRADPNFAGRDQALLTNTGPFEPLGYLEAGDIVLAARDTLFVQNSGSLISFAGITVRENTLRLIPTGTQPLRVFAFGRRINPGGSFVTNNAFFAEVEFQGRGGTPGYADEAQFNLCFINTGVCRLPSPDDPLPGGPDIIEEPVGDGSTAISLPGTADDLVDSSFAQEPLIEEPVTSGADSILWDCDNDDDGDCDEDDVDG